MDDDLIMNVFPNSLWDQEWDVYFEAKVGPGEFNG